MKKIIINIFLGVLISLLLLILSVQFFTFNNSYLYNNINKNLPIDNKDLYTIANNLSNYLKDDTNNLNFKVTYNNKNVFAFNKKEIDHMEDVKSIYLLINKLKYIIIFFIFLIVSIVRKKYLLNSAYYSTFVSFLILLILSITIININFNSIFIKFHELAFSNELWILNPKTDLLINLVPLNFFIDISKNIAILFVLLQLIVSLLSFYFKKNIQNKLRNRYNY
jgi:integral membrane protein (TIGR01906 family)